jgi:hypothetical protein
MVNRDPDPAPGISPLYQLSRPSPWWANGLGWLLFLVAPGCGLALGLAIGRVVWG